MRRSSVAVTRGRGRFDKVEVRCVGCDLSRTGYMDPIIKATKDIQVGPPPNKSLTPRSPFRSTLIPRKILGLT